MVTSQPSDLHLTGEPVEISYVVDPAIGHGQFLLENRGTNAANASVQAAWLQLGSRRQSLAGVTVYVLGEEQMVDADDFQVAAQSTLNFLLGFPAVAYEPPFGESVAVGLQLKVNGAELEALSPITFVRRLPRR